MTSIKILFIIWLFNEHRPAAGHNEHRPAAGHNKHRPAAGHNEHRPARRYPQVSCKSGYIRLV